MGAAESIFWEDDDGTASQQSIPHPSSRPSPNRPPIGPRKAGRHPPPPILRIKGLLLGGPKTGKRTLLARLQGIDPYAPKGESQTSDPSSAPSAPPVRAANIQYQPTDRKQCWDRILLQVQTTRTINPEQHGATDFAILLIHPQHRFEKTRSYVLSVVATLLRQAGYKPKQQPPTKKDEFKNDEPENEAKTDEPTNEKSKDEDVEMRPICLCVLFNFRDIELPEEKRTEIQDNIQKLIHTLIQDHFEVPNEIVALQFAETCLRNCYGLNALHHFIYRTYLLCKQIDLQRQLKQVQQQADKTEEYLVMSYNEFVDVLESDVRQQQEEQAEPQSRQQDARQQQAQASLEPQSDLVAESVQLRQQMLLQQQQLQQKQQVRPSIENISKPPQSSEPMQQPKAAASDVTPIRRNVMFQQFPPEFPFGMGKDALEAFLADSSDEEEEQRTPQQKAKKPKSNVVFDSSDDDDDDDDDEDDFFYDERGNRRVNHPSLTRNATSTMKIEALPSASSKAAPYRPPVSEPSKSGEPESTAPVVVEEKEAVQVPQETESPKAPNTDKTCHDSHQADESPKAALSPEKSTQEAKQDDEEESSHTSPKNTGAPAQPALMVATNAADDGWSDEDDDDDFVIETSPVLESDEEEEEEETKDRTTSESPITTPASPMEDAVEDDHEEAADFVVAQGTSAVITSVSDDDSWGDNDDNGNYQPISMAPAAPSPPVGGGLSAAAMAAIAAAQKEAEAMLRQQEAPSEIIPERKKKKKKDKSEKKEKRNKSKKSNKT